MRPQQAGQAPADNLARSVRQRLGLTQGALAAQIGASVRTVQDWEQGRRVPAGPACALLTILAEVPAIAGWLLERRASLVATAAPASAPSDAAGTNGDAASGDAGGLDCAAAAPPPLELESGLCRPLPSQGAAVYERLLGTERIDFVYGLDRLLGEEPVGSRTLAWWQQSLHPDDLEVCLTEIRRAIAAERDFSLQYRVRHVDGRYLVVQESTAIVPAGEGRPARLVGVMIDVTARAELEQALRASEETRRLALEGASLGTWWSDPTRRVMHLDDRARAMLGLTESRPISFEEAHELTHPDDRELDQHALEVAVTPGSEGRFEIEKRVLHAEGGLRWFAARGQALFEDGPRPTRVVGVLQDVSERRRTEQRLETLLAELNHRVKNTLAAVQTVARQTLAGDDVTPPVRARLEGRLQALAHAHSLLAEANWEGADLRALAEVELAPFEGRVRLEGGRRMLTPRAALTLCVTLHELTTNAAKHGALSKPEGRVDLAWSVEGRGRAARLRLIWQERGGGSVTRPESTGFGLKLIERAVPYDLSGSVQLDFGADGLTCILSAPAAEALTPS
jgi:PAS domain S-box-containing protein